MLNANKKAFLVMGIMIIIILFTFIISVNTGYVKLSIRNFNPSDLNIIMQFRLPRIITAILIGIGLSVSGCVLQTISKNEMADPGILGINAGASLGIAIYISVFNISLGSSSYIVPFIALIGAVLSSILIYGLSYVKKEGITPGRIILVGVGVSTAINSLTLLLLMRMRGDEFGFIQSWMSGDIWGASWSNISIMIPWITVFTCYIFYKSKTLDIFALDNGTAIGIGLLVQKESIKLLVASVALASMCVAVGGGITFVGLICPHISRKLVGPRHKLLIPTTALTGTVLMLISDIISRRIIAPNQISIGIVVAIIGAPYFLYLLANSDTV